MTQFQPKVNHFEHVSLENILINKCRSLGIECLDLPQYYDLDEKNKYRPLFNHVSLYIRSSPDKFVLAKKPFLVDVKSQMRKETGNISIELSAFHFNLERCKMGIPVFYLCTINGEARIFSPLRAKPQSIFIQPKWATTDIFDKYASALRTYFETCLPYSLIIRREDTSGSQDPFVLIPITGLDSYELGEFIRSRELK